MFSLLICILRVARELLQMKGVRLLVLENILFAEPGDWIVTGTHIGFLRANNTLCGYKISEATKDTMCTMLMEYGKQKYTYECSYIEEVIIPGPLTNSENVLQQYMDN